MKRRFVVTALLTMTLAGGGAGVDAVLAADPWESILCEAVREGCDRGAGAPREPFREGAGAERGPRLPHERPFTGEMHGPPGPPLPGEEWGDRPHHRRGPCPPCLAWAIDLSDRQKKEIGAVFRGEREKGEALGRREGELRRQLLQAERTLPLDEKGVRAAASGLAQMETERIVSRARARAMVASILTPAQRELMTRAEREAEAPPPPPPPGRPR